MRNITNHVTLNMIVKNILDGVKATRVNGKVVTLPRLPQTGTIEMKKAFALSMAKEILK